MHINLIIDPCCVQIGKNNTFVPDIPIYSTFRDYVTICYHINDEKDSIPAILPSMVLSGSEGHVTITVENNPLLCQIDTGDISMLNGKPKNRQKVIMIGKQAEQMFDRRAGIEWMDWKTKHLMNLIQSIQELLCVSVAAIQEKCHLQTSFDPAFIESLEDRDLDVVNVIYGGNNIQVGSNNVMFYNAAESLNTYASAFNKDIYEDSFYAFPE